MEYIRGGVHRLKEVVGNSKDFLIPTLARSPEEFADLVQRRGLDVSVDVRYIPGHFVPRSGSSLVGYDRYEAAQVLATVSGVGEPGQKVVYEEQYGFDPKEDRGVRVQRCLVTAAEVSEGLSAMVGKPVSIVGYSEEQVRELVNKAREGGVQPYQIKTQR